MQILFENVHTVREEEATWSGRLPCAFFQSLPSGIPLPQSIIIMPYSIHQNCPSVVPCTPKCQVSLKRPKCRKLRILQSPGDSRTDHIKPSGIGVLELLKRAIATSRSEYFTGKRITKNLSAVFILVLKRTLIS